MRYVLQREHAIAATLIVVLVMVTASYIMGQCDQTPRQVVTVQPVPEPMPVIPEPVQVQPTVDVTVTPIPVIVEVEPERCRPIMRTLRWVFCPRCR